MIYGSQGDRDLLIVQLPWLLKEQRLASFEWMARKENIEWALDDSRLGVEYEMIKNTPQQIIDVTLEMIQRLNGSWSETAEDIELQARYRKAQELLPLNGRTPSRMGAKFLREHQHLLPQ